MIPGASGSWVETVFGIAGTGGLLTSIILAAQLYIGKRTADRKADLDLEVHRDGLTFELLEAARSEVAALRHEIDRNRFNREHVEHFETALRHIEALLLAENETELKSARRQAQAFLNRMKRMQEARGIVRNEMQRIESEERLSPRKEDQ